VISAVKTPNSRTISSGSRRLSRNGPVPSADVAVPEPAYPVYERGALFGGGAVVRVPLSENNGWLPDLDRFDAWDDIGLFWVAFRLLTVKDVSWGCLRGGAVAARAPRTF